MPTEEENKEKEQEGGGVNVWDVLPWLSLAGLAGYSFYYPLSGLVKFLVEHPSAWRVIKNKEALKEKLKLPEKPGFTQVFHGSEKKFKKFDTDKLLTGEGANAFGKGGYVTKSVGKALKYPTYERNKYILTGYIPELKVAVNEDMFSDYWGLTQRKANRGSDLNAFTKGHYFRINTGSKESINPSAVSKGEKGIYLYSPGYPAGTFPYDLEELSKADEKGIIGKIHSQNNVVLFHPDRDFEIVKWVKTRGGIRPIGKIINRLKKVDLPEAPPLPSVIVQKTGLQKYIDEAKASLIKYLDERLAEDPEKLKEFISVLKQNRSSLERTHGDDYYHNIHDLDEFIKKMKQKYESPKLPDYTIEFPPKRGRRAKPPKYVDADYFKRKEALSLDDVLSRDKLNQRYFLTGLRSQEVGEPFLNLSIKEAFKDASSKIIGSKRLIPMAVNAIKGIAGGIATSMIEENIPRSLPADVMQAGIPTVLDKLLNTEVNQEYEKAKRVNDWIIENSEKYGLKEPVRVTMKKPEEKYAPDVPTLGTVLVGLLGKPDGKRKAAPIETPAIPYVSDLYNLLMANPKQHIAPSGFNDAHLLPFSYQYRTKPTNDYINVIKPMF